MNRSTLLVGLALATMVAVVAGAVLLAPSTPEVEESTYGYSLSVETNATLENVTLYVPLPVSGDGTAPIAAAFREGSATVPEPWRAAVVETDRGTMLRLAAAEVTAERRPDGRRNSLYLFGANRTAAAPIDTSDPFGHEPVLPATDGYRERPCPNVVEQSPDEACYAFDTGVYATYDAPAGADVGIILVVNGVNTYRGSAWDHTMYHERVMLTLDGPQDGWVDAEGFASTEATP